MLERALRRVDATGCPGDTPAPLADSNKPQTTSSEAPVVAPSGSGSTPNAAASGEPARGASGSGEEAPPKRRRRRRRGGRNKKSGTAPETGAAPAAPALDPGLAALAGGLLSHVDDREIQCSADGCNNTWVWTAAEQIAAYGQPAPKRECGSCSGVAATEVGCSVDGCKRTWVWTREAQLKHRAWQRRGGDERRGGKKRGRRGRRNDGRPRHKCEPCQAKFAKLAERPSVCKVHGCTRPVMVDRDAQLRAWAATGNTDLEFEAALPKVMCEVCREFCRTHDDRGVACGRPGCERTWTYKRGAQLQAFLAGRFEDPIRLCEPCESETRKAAHTGGTPANVDVMPCIVPGCDGVWHHRAGQKIPACQDGEQPVQRMCDEHRKANGANPRSSGGQGHNAPTSEAAAPQPEVIPNSPESDPEKASAGEPIS